MKKILAIILAVALVASVSGISLAPGKAEANGAWIQFGFGLPGETYVANYSAAECVDLLIEVEDPDGIPDDLVEVYINGVLVLTLPMYTGSVSTTVSLTPGVYTITFLYVAFDFSPSTAIQYRLTENPFTGNYVIPELIDCPAPEVTIDIKPWSDPNSINPEGNGVVPVAILGSDTFDVTTIDVSSIRFGPAGGPHNAEPVHNGHILDANSDGWADLVVHFMTQETGLSACDDEGTIIGEFNLDCDCEISLVTPFEASDSVRLTTANENWAEPNNSLNQARRVKLPFDTDPANRYAEIWPTGGDVDYYRFRAEANTTLMAEIISAEFDSLIGLFDEDGNLLDFDDDGGAGLLSKLIYPIWEKGEYILAVTAWADYDFDGDGLSGGCYVLDVFAVEGIVLPLGDDDTIEVSLGFTFPYQGQDWTSVWVNSNGNLTFGSGDTDFSQTVAEFLADQPRIAPLWDDLNPNTGGQITVEGDDTSMTVSWIGVPEWFATGANTFSVTLSSDGSIEIVYGALTATDGLVGVTEGGGAADPGETDLSANPNQSASGTTYEIFTAGDNDLDGETLTFTP
jgi:hypothetical protein